MVILWVFSSVSAGNASDFFKKKKNDRSLGSVVPSHLTVKPALLTWPSGPLDLALAGLSGPSITTPYLTPYTSATQTA